MSDSMEGTRISHFEVVSRLGEGGMGVVYRAIDLNLNRPVALKFLAPGTTSDPKARERFMQEARAASALEDEHICTIYEIGEGDSGGMYIAMALYEGETLKERLDRTEKGLGVDQAMAIAAQTARGLYRAHTRGIIHRDIKPANLMITERGTVKILDFGLAKLGMGGELTKAGTTLGTTSYMAPEMARGEDASAAADVWSLGVILYEMLTGDKPFGGGYEQAIIYNILNQAQPTIPDDVAPEPVRHLVAAMLDKDPTARWSLTLDNLRELESHAQMEGSIIHPGAPSRARSAEKSPSGERATSSDIAATADRSESSGSRLSAINTPRPWMPAAIGVLSLVLIAVVAWAFLGGGGEQGASSFEDGVTSLAILPLESRSATEGDDTAFFADGIHDDLMTQLSKVSAMRVISRPSVMQYRGTDKTTMQIAEELGVTALLVGSVQRAGDRVRINTQLISADTDAQIWGESYDEALTAANIFSIQADISRQIAQALRAELLPAEEEALTEPATQSLEAYELYQRARYLRLNGDQSRGSYDGSIVLLEEALELDPNYAEAWAEYARNLLGLWNGGYEPTAEIKPRIEEALETAVRLNPDIPEVHLQRAMLRRNELRLDEAEAEFKKAIELNPSFAQALSDYSNFLTMVRRFDEGLVMAERAQQLDPLSAQIRMAVYNVLFHMGEYQRAVDETTEELVADPSQVYIRYFRAMSRSYLGDYDGALEDFDIILATSNEHFINLIGTAWVLAKSGRVDEAMEILSELKDAYGMAMADQAYIYAEIGDLDTAFDIFDTVYAEDPSGLRMLSRDATTPELRADPRFKDLLERLGLPE